MMACNYHRFCISECYYTMIIMRLLNRSGSKSGATVKCAGCQGSGMKVSIRQLGPGMIQQMQQVCPSCQGSGMYNLVV